MWIKKGKTSVHMQGATLKKPLEMNESLLTDYASAANLSVVYTSTVLSKHDEQ